MILATGSSSVCRDESVTLFRTGSLVTENGLPPSLKLRSKLKYARKNLNAHIRHQKKKKKKKEKRSRNFNSR